jgi:hypothetical protein
VKFDKSQYDATSELVVLEEQESVSASGGLGYIQDNLTLA